MCQKYPQLYRKKYDDLMLKVATQSPHYHHLVPSLPTSPSPSSFPPHPPSPHHDEDEPHTRHDPLGSDGLGEGRFTHAGNGVPFPARRLGCELRSRPLLLLLEVEAVPVVGQGGALTLPVLQERHGCGGGGEAELRRGGKE